MFSGITERLSASKRSIGLEIFFGEQLMFRAVMIQRSGNKIKTVSVKTGENISAVRGIFEAGVPVYLGLNGRGVLVKKVQAAASDSLQSLMHKALPGSGENDFYVHVQRGASADALVAMVRRSQLDEILRELKDAGAGLVMLLPGISVVHNLSLLAGKEKINASGFEIHCGTDSISEIFSSDTEHDLNIAGEKIQSPFITAYALAVLPYAGNVDTENSVGPEWLADAADELKQKRLFRNSAMLFTAFLFCLLLINYFAFQHYWDRRNDLQEQVRRSGGEAERIRSLRRDVESKKTFLEGAGLLLPARHSYYSDRLAASVPAGLVLSEMSLAPKLRTLQSDSIAFKPGKILVAGSCRQSITLNEWIGLLKNYPWIKNVTLSEYKQDKSQENGLFTIEIDTR